jgi:hypothetical protein
MHGYFEEWLHHRGRIILTWLYWHVIIMQRGNSGAGGQTLASISKAMAIDEWLDTLLNHPNAQVQLTCMQNKPSTVLWSYTCIYMCVMYDALSTLMSLYICVWDHTWALPFICIIMKNKHLLSYGSSCELVHSAGMHTVFQTTILIISLFLQQDKDGLHVHCCILRMHTVFQRTILIIWWFLQQDKDGLHVH